MNKSFKRILMVMTIICCVMLTGCINENKLENTENEETNYEDKSKKSVYKDEKQEIQEKSTVRITNKEISDDEVMKLYDKAKKIWVWFNISGLTSQFDVKIEKQDDKTGKTNIYCKCDDFDTYDEFITYLEDVFSKEKIDEFLSKNNYVKGHDGGLYSNIGGKGWGYDIVKIDHTIIRENSKKIIVKMKYYCDENGDSDMNSEDKSSTYTATIDNVLEYKDGKWIFTSFDNDHYKYTDKLEVEQKEGKN